MPTRDPPYKINFLLRGSPPGRGSVGLGALKDNKVCFICDYHEASECY